MFRNLAYATVCALALVFPPLALADTVAVTGGSGFLYWDGSLTSITIYSADSRFTTEVSRARTAALPAGAPSI